MYEFSIYNTMPCFAESTSFTTHKILDIARLRILLQNALGLGAVGKRLIIFRYCRCIFIYIHLHIAFSCFSEPGTCFEAFIILLHICHISALETNKCRSKAPYLFSSLNLLKHTLPQALRLSGWPPSSLRPISVQKSISRFSFGAYFFSYALLWV